tara:strand:+ start:637 stop:798 length:162 start_codon:yes stop_codon:yes gene_type:complete
MQQKELESTLYWSLKSSFDDLCCTSHDIAKMMTELDEEKIINKVVAEIMEGRE